MASVRGQAGRRCSLPTWASFTSSCTTGTIFAVSDLPAAPFVAEHVGHGAQAFFRIAEGIDGLLQAKFGGRTAFSESMPSMLKH